MLEVKDEPYLLKEDGWGEFDLRIILHFLDDFAPREIIVFDLNFREPKYSKSHMVVSNKKKKSWLEEEHSVN
jgi:transcription initiation factor IIF auxiliary subunit